MFKRPVPHHLRGFIIAACLLLSGITFNAHAQLLPETNAEAEKPVEYPSDPLNRRTPRGTVNGFFKAMGEQDYNTASQYLDLKRSQRRTRQRERIVENMQKLLDQGGDILPTALLSNKYEGRTDDELEEGFDMVGTVTANGEVIDLVVKNTEAAGKPPVWRFSTETVDAISKVIITDDVLLIDKIIPESMDKMKLAGVPVGHWLAVVVLALIAYFFSWGVVALFCFLIHKLWKQAQKEHISAIIDALNLPIRLYLAVWVFVALSQRVGISIIVRQRFSTITITIGIIGILILLWRLSDIIGNYTQSTMTRRKRVSAVSVILFVKRISKGAIVILGIIAILGAIGVDVTAGLAALGIGGLALALGAQKTVENFVGSVTLISDQPLRVGDFCKVGNVSGSVEAIGMRSTRLRTGERTVVYIPNGELAASQIENYAHRDRYLYNPTLQFRLETTPDQIRYLLVELRAILYAHPSVNPDPAKVRFTGFSESAIKVEIYAYVEAPSVDDYHEVREDLLLHMMDVIARSGTSLATPAQTIFMARDKALPEDKIQQVADTVKSWKENNEMQLPKFDPEQVEAIKGTLPYPPEGSAMNKVDDDIKGK